MFRTIFEKSSGTIISSVDLSESQLAAYLNNNSNHDYLNIYTKGVKDIAVDTVTRKLKKDEVSLSIIKIMKLK